MTLSKITVVVEVSECKSAILGGDGIILCNLTGFTNQRAECRYGLYRMFAVKWEANTGALSMDSPVLLAAAVSRSSCMISGLHCATRVGGLVLC